MRIRTVTISAVAIVAVSAGFGLTACTSSGSGAKSPYCRELSAAAQRISAAQADLYSNTPHARHAMAELVAELRGLQADAPAQIKTAVAELGRAFQTAQDLVRHPDPAASARLASVAGTLGRDGRTITNYVKSQCD